MRNQAIAYAAAAAMGLGTLIAGSAIAEDRAGMPPGNADAQRARTGIESNLSAQGEQDFKNAFMAADTPDELFLVCAAAEGQCELKAAQMAQQKAQDPQVKSLAQKIEQDHQQANQRLQQAAQQANVQLPKGDNPMSDHARQIFEKLNGKEFDQYYVSWVRATHAKAVNEFRDMAQLSKIQAIKDYAQQTLPALQAHYQLSQTTATALGIPSGLGEAVPAGARFQSDNTAPFPATPAPDAGGKPAPGR